MKKPVLELEPGERPAGWTLSGWLHHLRRLAENCEPHNPERAAELRRLADLAEARGGGVENGQ